MKTGNCLRGIEGTLAGKMLVASPFVPDHSYFFQAVIYMLKNTETGSLGVIINHPMEELKEMFLLGSKIGVKPLSLGQAYIGGFIGRDIGCLLCLEQYNGIDSTQFIKIGGDQALKNIIQNHDAVKQTMLILGHCGWKSGQLEEEIKHGLWIVLPIDQTIIFKSDNKDKWIKCINSLKIDLACYVSNVGNG